MRGARLAKSILLCISCGSISFSVAADGLLDVYQLSMTNDPVYLAEVHKLNASQDLAVKTTRISFAQTIPFSLRVKRISPLPNTR